MTDGWGAGFDDPDFGDEEWDEIDGKASNWPLLAAGAVGSLLVVLVVAFFFTRGGDDAPVEGESVSESNSVARPTTSLEGDAPSSSGVSILQIDAPVSCLAGSAPVEHPIQAFLDAAMAQQGDAYVLGAEVDASDLDPQTFDTSELVEWSAAQAGVVIVDGSWLQYLDLVDCGTVLSTDEALNTPGALIFGFTSEPTRDAKPDGSFVVISLGDGSRVIDVRKDGVVGVFPASEFPTDRQFTHAARIPDLGTGEVQ